MGNKSTIINREDVYVLNSGSLSDLSNTPYIGRVSAKPSNEVSPTIDLKNTEQLNPNEIRHNMSNKITSAFGKFKNFTGRIGKNMLSSAKEYAVGANGKDFINHVIQGAVRSTFNNDNMVTEIKDVDQNVNDVLTTEGTHYHVPELPQESYNKVLNLHSKALQQRDITDRTNFNITTGLPGARDNEVTTYLTSADVHHASKRANVNEINDYPKYIHHFGYELGLRKHGQLMPTNEFRSQIDDLQVGEYGTRYELSNDAQKVVDIRKEVKISKLYALPEQLLKDDMFSYESYTTSNPTGLLVSCGVPTDTLADAIMSGGKCTRNSHVHIDDLIHYKTNQQVDFISILNCGLTSIESSILRGVIPHLRGDIKVHQSYVRLAVPLEVGALVMFNGRKIFYPFNPVESSVWNMGARNKIDRHPYLKRNFDSSIIPKRGQLDGMSDLRNIQFFSEDLKVLEKASKISDVLSSEDFYNARNKINLHRINKLTKAADKIAEINKYHTPMDDKSATNQAHYQKMVDYHHGGDLKFSYDATWSIHVPLNTCEKFTLEEYGIQSQHYINGSDANFKMILAVRHHPDVEVFVNWRIEDIMVTPIYVDSYSLYGHPFKVSIYQALGAISTGYTSDDPNDILNVYQSVFKPFMKYKKRILTLFNESNLSYTYFNDLLMKAYKTANVLFKPDDIPALSKYFLSTVLDFMYETHPIAPFTVESKHDILNRVYEIYCQGIYVMSVYGQKRVNTRNQYLHSANEMYNRDHKIVA